MSTMIKIYAIALLVVCLVGFGYAWSQPDPTVTYKQLEIAHYTSQGLNYGYKVTSDIECVSWNSLEGPMMYCEWRTP